MLASCGDGSKLKPVVIFKRKTVPNINNKHGVVVSAQEKGWMDSDQMDGTEDDMVYSTPEDTEELDDSFIRELFESDSESDFEGFVV